MPNIKRAALKANTTKSLIFILSPQQDLSPDQNGFKGGTPFPSPQPSSYWVAGLRGGATGADGLANFAASIGTFGCTSLSSVVACPSVQVTTVRKGILTPATSR